MSTTCAVEKAPTTPGAGDRLPWAALLTMALMGFLLIATETMPAGLLPQIASAMKITEGTAGQLVSAYALGTVIMTIPATALTRGMRRKPVVTIGMLGFLAANILTAVSPEIVLSLAARFVAGGFSGLVWGLLAGYARRISAPEHAGRALAVASIGTPVGLAVGTPFGSWIGSTFDWRYSFVVLSLLTLTIIALTIVLVPDAPGQKVASRVSVPGVFAIPGVALILVVIFTWMLAHNIVYTYIASYLRFAAVGLTTEVALVMFGVAAMAGVWITGALVDRALRPLVLVSIALFGIAGAIFVLGHQSLVAVLIAIALWGVAFGGAATQLQTAMGNASGENADVANSLLGVSFNVAIFAAGVIGAVLIGTYNGLVLPIAMIALSAAAFLVALDARRAAFPAVR